MRQLANQACWQQKHRQLFCRGFIWTRAMQLFTALMGNHHQGFYLCSPILWSVDVEETTMGGSRESKSKMACGPLMSCHCPPSSFSPLFLRFFFCPVCLFLRVPGMPPIFLCSNYCLTKLCQRAEIVLMRGPAAFASVIWWVSLGTHKTRHTRGYVATSEPRGRPRLFLAPSCCPVAATSFW